jgi:GNAT superfamily N-acetyltransferase
MITIRPMEPPDVEALLALGEIAVNETRYQSQLFDAVKVRRQFEAYFRDQRNKYIWLIAMRDGKLQGLLFASVEEYWFTQARGANMILWYVAQEARGSAMAVKLLLALRGWAENRQATELTLSVTSGTNFVKTGRFLRRLGFPPRGENFHMTLGMATASRAARDTGMSPAAV